VLLSTSTTALLATLLVLAGGIALAGLRQGGLVMLSVFWLVLVLLLGLGGVATMAPDVILEPFGKDATLTGRTGLWEALSRRIELRPWEGYGYGAFWTDPQGPAFYVRRDVGWRAPTAHNGWLEVLVQLGWMGLALFAAHFALSAAAAGRRLISGGEGMWAVLSTALFLLFSLSESTIMQQNNINWVLYVATTAKLLERRRAPGPAAAYKAPQAGRGFAAIEAASVRRTSAAP
jgi:O-antigen ligase